MWVRAIPNIYTDYGMNGLRVYHLTVMPTKYDLKSNILLSQEKICTRFIGTFNRKTVL